MDEFRMLLSEHEAPYELGAWEKFEQKRQRKRRRVAWYRIGGMAASLSLIILSLWMGNDMINDRSPETLISHKKFEEDTLTQTIHKVPGNNALSSEEILSSKNNQTDDKNNMTKKSWRTTAKNVKVALSSTPKADNTEQDFPMIQRIDKISPLGVSLILPALPAILPLENKSYASLFSEDDAFIIQQNLEKLKSESKNNPVIFGITLSSLMSSAPKASSAQLGVGGGVTTEIPFTSTLALYTGVQLSDQTLQSEVNEKPTVISGSKALQSITTDLLSLDIPVNVRYTFSEGKDNAMYVAAGVSSLAYLSETTASAFLVPHTRITFREAENGETMEVYETVQMPETEVRQSSAFEQFDLAGQLNLSFGYAYKLAGQWHLVIEPYYKHPLGKLTSSELSFSTAGVNLRFNFGGKGSK